MKLRRKVISNSTIGIVTIAIIIFFLIVIDILGIIKLSIEKTLYDTVGVIIGIIIVKFLADYIKRSLSKWDLNAASSISFIVQIFGYTLVFLVFISFYGGFTVALTTGGFAGIVLGLAAQTTLSNVFAGLMLVFSKPFKPGDKITFATSFFGKTFVSYSPKFYSSDELVNGFTGVVKDISLMYTTIVTEDNLELRVPNSAMIQAAIILEKESTTLVRYRKSRIRIEFPLKKDPEIIKEELEKIAKEIDEIKSYKVYLEERTPTNYVFIIEYTSSYSPRIVKDKFLLKTKGLK